MNVSTKGNTDVLDITQDVCEEIKKAKLVNGTVTIFVSGSTAGVTTIEYEDGLIEDLKNIFENIAPSKNIYQHNKRWGDGNGFSHVRASILGPELTIPVADGKMLLGTWQQIVLVDFDNRPRQRKIILQFMGE